MNTYFGMVAEKTEGGVKFQLFAGEDCKQVIEDKLIAFVNSPYAEKDDLIVIEFNTMNIIKAFAWMLSLNAKWKK